MEQEFKEQNNVIKLSQLVDKIEDMGDSSSIEELLRIQVLTPNDYQKYLNIATSFKFEKDSNNNNYEEIIDPIIDKLNEVSDIY